ncbi:conjugative transposon protein TraM [Porphyromonas gingivicanis]|uniref:conjugative transposon protein TraM n=1 Tax=Porphyromonas gingivicanis TaxID=266762 RepID=UPI000471B0F1|nr:conjugative transposon protein TraM [Porphyromonas gingivicanis]
MKIDRANKAKIIIFASMGIAIILVIMLFIFSSSKEDKIEDVSVRMEEQSDLTIDDILQQQESSPSSNDFPALLEAERILSEDYVATTEDDDVRRLQEQLRSISRADNSYNPTPDYSYQEVAPSRPQKRSILETQQKEVSSPVVIEEQEVLPQKEEAPKKKSRFFSSSSNQTNSNTIEAKVSGEQKVKSGGTLKLILSQDVVLPDGTLLQKGTPLFGQVELSKNRLQVHISSIRIKNDILPFRKTVYDRDGLAGIYIPDNPTAEIASDATSTAVSNATIGATGSAVVDGTVQVIESVAKGAMQKKQARPTITIKSNYKVLLQ